MKVGNPQKRQVWLSSSTDAPENNYTSSKDAENHLLTHTAKFVTQRDENKPRPFQCILDLEGSWKPGHQSGYGVPTLLTLRHNVIIYKTFILQTTQSSYKKKKKSHTHTHTSHKVGPLQLSLASGLQQASVREEARPRLPHPTPPHPRNLFLIFFFFL